MTTERIAALKWAICHDTNIYVFRNGVVGTKPTLIHISFRDKKDMQSILSIIQERINFPVGYATDLYDMNGCKICAVYELENYTNYVVATNCKRRFKPVRYGLFPCPALFLSSGSKHVRNLRLQNIPFDYFRRRSLGLSAGRPANHKTFVSDGYGPTDMPLSEYTICKPCGPLCQKPIRDLGEFTGDIDDDVTEDVDESRCRTYFKTSEVDASTSVSYFLTHTESNQNISNQTSQNAENSNGQTEPHDTVGHEFVGSVGDENQTTQKNPEEKTTFKMQSTLNLESDVMNANFVGSQHMFLTDRTGRKKPIRPQGEQSSVYLGGNKGEKKPSVNTMNKENSVNNNASIECKSKEDCNKSNTILVRPRSILQQLKESPTQVFQSNVQLNYSSRLPENSFTNPESWNYNDRDKISWYDHYQEKRLSHPRLANFGETSPSSTFNSANTHSNTNHIANSSQLGIVANATSQGFLVGPISSSSSSQSEIDSPQSTVLQLKDSTSLEQPIQQIHHLELQQISNVFQHMETHYIPFLSAQQFPMCNGGQQDIMIAGGLHQNHQQERRNLTDSQSLPNSNYQHNQLVTKDAEAVYPTWQQQLKPLKPEFKVSHVVSPSSSKPLLKKQCPVLYAQTFQFQKNQQDSNKILPQNSTQYYEDINGNIVLNELNPLVKATQDYEDINGNVERDRYHNSY